MQIVIEISEKDYSRLKEIPYVFDSLVSRLYNAVKDGTPLPADYGRLIDADRVEDITWEAPSYNDALNVLTEVRDKVRALPTIIEMEVKVDAE